MMINNDSWIDDESLNGIFVPATLMAEPTLGIIDRHSG
jgi:hypothetical protein